MIPNKMHKRFIWSISKWRDFEQCPRMCRAKHVIKVGWQEQPNEAMERGKRIHKALEEAIKYNLELPNELAHMRPVVESFVAMKPQGWAVYPEMKFGVSGSFGKVDFFDGEDLRVRCVLDLFVQRPGKTLIVDWKSGKRKDEHEQDAEFYGAMTHLAFGGENETSSMYCYVDDLPRTFETTPKESWKIAAAWWKKFDYAEQLILIENAPATPCNACAWCGDGSCQYNKNRKLGNG